MAEPEINAFVTHLAVAENVSASTQTQALSALLFLYRHVLHREVGELHELVRARKQPRLPVVLSREEVRAVLHELDRDDRQSWLIASLLYGAGLRLNECLRLRVLDLDLARGELIVRSGKGGKDRATTLPQALVPDLREQLRRAQPPPRARPRRRLGRRRAPRGSGAQVPARSVGVALAVGLPPAAPLDRRAHRPPGPSPRPPEHRPARRQGGRPARRHRQARHLPHAAPLLRHPPARDRLRHPHHPGAPRPQGRRHHHDLHPRPAARRPGRAQPARRPHLRWSFASPWQRFRKGVIYGL